MTFVGRESELANLVRRYEAARHGTGSLFLISGSPGIGKSELVRQFSHAIAPLGARFALGGNLHVAQSPCAPFVEALGDDFLLRLEAPEAGVLAIEDIQWADDATLELVARLHRRIERFPLLVVLTMQTPLFGSGERSPALEHLLPAFEEHLELGPLGLADVRACVRERNAPNASGAACRQVERVCGGNPRYIQELLEAPAVAVPRSVRNAVERALFPLTAQQRRLVESAAVLGEEFDHSVLCATATCEANAVSFDLQAIHDRGLLTGGSPGFDYAFAHPLVREAVYSRIPPAIRASAHAAAAIEIERSNAAGERDALLAEHWYASTQRERCMEYAERAAARAETFGAYAEAAHWHQRLLEFAPENSRERADRCRRVGLALYAAGSVAESQPYVEEAAAFFGAAGNPQKAVELLRLLASELWLDGDGDGALAVVENALHHLRDCPDSTVTSHLLVKAASLCDLLGMRERSLELLERIEKTPGRLSRDLRSRYYNVRGCCNARAGRFEAAVADFHLALGDQRGSRHHDVMIAASQNAHACLRSAGRYEQAEQHARAALEYAHRHHVGTLLESTLGLVQADLLALRGKVAEAVRLVESVIESDLDFDLLRLEMLACGLSVALVADRQDLVEVCYRDRAVEAAFSCRDRAATGAVVAAAARMHAAAGDTATARALLHRGVRAAHGSELVEPLALAVAEFASLTDAKRGRALLTAMHPGDATPAYIGLYDAFIAHRRGDVRETQRCAVLASASFERLGLPLLAARGLELAGRQKRALAIYRECGATRAANRLQAVFQARGRRGGGTLTQRQLEIGRYVAAGQNNRAIARDLRISSKTLESHLTAIYRRLGVADRSGIAAYVLQHGLA